MNIQAETIVRHATRAALGAVLGMIAIFFLTGIGQDPLQFVRPPAEYTALLLERPPMLRAVIALDNLFIVFYTAAFVGLGLILPRLGAPRLVVGLAVGLLLALALLDYAENLNFLVMLNDAEQGRPPSAAAISWQVYESLMKFHVSYLGLFLLGLALPRRDWRERLLANLSIYVQLPVGVLIYVTPPAVSFALVFVRFVYFVAGLVLIGAIYGKATAGGTD